MLGAAEAAGNGAPVRGARYGANLPSLYRGTGDGRPEVWGDDKDAPLPCLAGGAVVVPDCCCCCCCWVDWSPPVALGEVAAARLVAGFVDAAAAVVPPLDAAAGDWEVVCCC